MKKLTKKYRLIWDEKGDMISDPFEEYPETTETIVGKGRGSFETDDISEVENIIKPQNYERYEN